MQGTLEGAHAITLVQRLGRVVVDLTLCLRQLINRRWDDQLLVSASNCDLE